MSSEFKVGSWNGDACRVLTVSCLLVIGVLGLNSPTVSSYNSMGTTDLSSIISLSYQLRGVYVTGTPSSQAVRFNRQSRGKSRESRKSKEQPDSSEQPSEQTARQPKPEHDLTDSCLTSQEREQRAERAKRAKRAESKEQPDSSEQPLEQTARQPKPEHDLTDS